MKRFITKTTAFCASLLPVFLIPWLFLYISGESFRNLDDIINRQNYLIGYAYSEENYRYLKQKELSSRNTPTVIALGSSRVLQFRDKMFTSSFYNAGFTISSISDFIPFIETNFKSKKPDVLLIGLDQWMFNENWDNLENYDKTERQWRAEYTKNASMQTLSNVWTDLLKRKYGIETILSNYKSNKSKFGLNAIVKNRGFRKDGSMFYGDQITKLIEKDSLADDFGYRGTYSRIEDGDRFFEYGKKVNEKSLKALNDLLLFCKENDIYVVAILPPFANSVNSRLRQSEKYTYMDSVYHKANEVISFYDFELWDMSDLTKYNSNDDETLDGFHGSEVSHVKMLMHMIKKDSKLKNYTNLQRLENDLINKENRYSVYPNP
ncbi:hypothetical protein J0A67_01315 [Algoriphagus aestuariicola]|uniref:D-alanyl-lipoteichoic acid biosynthesis protein DltD n=1 Tax=Algoriphagus aestuariicola TaxID=1852016 RepID=A0ABS3BKB2_9BACT|nr:hypothetical protein [Algoriphagus aestuariicola]MBN7799475.1 hypothetical protein [Algoriphagus aestuariicola]